MKDRIRICVVLMAMLFAPKAWSIETSRHITRIVEQLSCELPDEGTFVCSQFGASTPLYVERQGNAITQVGVRLFTADMRTDLDDVVCNAVERIWLELMLCSDVQLQKKLLKEHRVSIVYNGFALGMPQYRSLNDALAVIRAGVALSMYTEDGQIRLRARLGDESLVITLPSDREVLYACDKKEHEDLLREDLEQWNTPCRLPSLPDPSELEAVAGGVYVCPGMAYMIDSLRSDTYYAVEGNSLRAYFKEEMPSLSLQNLLMGCVPANNVGLKLRYRTYERNERYCVLSLDKYLGYMQHQGLKFYSAVIPDDGDGLQGVLLMHHPIYNYIHMAIVRYDSRIFSASEATLEGDFYTFIPQHNIKSLFNF